MTAERTYKVKVKAPVGELLTAVTMSENDFNSLKGSNWAI